MNLNIGWLNKISFLYLIVSLCIFCCGWFNWPFLIISLAALVLISKKILTDFSQDNKHFFLESDYLIIIAIICLIASVSIGFNGLFWQATPDLHVRNAIMRDLITFPWPVIYDNNTALTYYFGFFLFPTLIGKCFHLFFNDINAVIKYTEYVALAWTFIGTFIVSLQIVILTKAEHIKSIVAVFIFLLFSGLDILLYQFPYPAHLHLDVGTAAYPFWYSNPYLTLKYAYHFAIPTWLTTCLFLQKKEDVSYFGIISMLMAFYCPSVLVGFTIFLIPIYLNLLFKNELNIKNFLKDTFSCSNILSVCVILPILYAFYQSNFMASHNIFELHIIDSHFLKIFFYEVFIYVLLVYYEYKKELLFYLMLISLFFLPLLSFQAYPSDFCLRALVPSIIILSLYVIRFLFTSKKSYKLFKYILSFALIIGSLTPLLSVFKEFDSMNETPQYIIKDEIKTFNQNIDENIGWRKFADNRNYTSIGINKYLFWNFIARRNKKF